MSQRNEALAEKLRKRQLYLLRHQVSFRNEISAFLRTLEKGIAAEIITISPSEPAREAYRRQRVDKLLQAVSTLISKTYRDIGKHATRELQGLAEVESFFLLQSVNELMGTNLRNIALDAPAALALVKDTMMSGAVLQDWLDEQSSWIKDRFAQEMRMGIVGGESDAEMVGRIRGTSELNYTDGLMEMSRRKAKILVRGASSAVVRETRTKSVLDNPDVFSGIQQVSVLDGRTSHTCISYAGKVWVLPGYKPIGHNLPYNGGTPRHPNCRSTEIPVIAGEPAADDIGFDDFIKDKPDAELNELLGRGRAELYRDQKITLSGLVDQAGRPLTLKQLREIV
ncbi:hypothetical protein ABIB06_006557 [Bradyrhizobium sp. LB8.2]|uniref:hypothetical protein n=1 Tax=unclassified Bradyrhizobium TaxID=2631580 RepID=UPI0033998C81